MFSEPVRFQAQAQGHAGTVQHDPAVGRRHAQFLTDLRGLQAEMFAHHEDPRGTLRQRAQAGLQRGEKLLLAERTLRLLPGSHRFLPVAAPVEQAVEFAVIGLGLEVGNRPLPALAADEVHDLVLQDPRQPGAQVRASGELRFAGERGEQRLLDGVLGGGLVAQLQRGVAQQVGPQLLDLGAEVGGRGQGLESGRRIPILDGPTQTGGFHGQHCKIRSIQ